MPVTVTEAFPFPAGDLLRDFYFDGDYITSHLIKSATLYKHNGHTTFRRWARDGDRWIEQTFRFKKVTVGKRDNITIHQTMNAVTEDK